MAVRDPITDLRDRLHRLIPPRGIRRAAREMGLPYTTLYDILERGNEARAENRAPILQWLARQEGLVGLNSGHDSVIRAARDVSPRDRAIAILQAIEDEDIPDLLAVLRDFASKRWSRQHGAQKRTLSSR